MKTATITPILIKLDISSMRLEIPVPNKFIIISNVIIVKARPLYTTGVPTAGTKPVNVFKNAADSALMVITPNNQPNQPTKKPG